MSEPLMHRRLLTAALLFGTAASAAPPEIAQLRWHRRVLLLSAPYADDPRLAAQRRALADWANEAAERDLTVITLIGPTVEGAQGSAAAIRQHYQLATHHFDLALIGKEGGVKRRSAEPMSGLDLAHLIDSMPMRRAGQR